MRKPTDPLLRQLYEEYVGDDPEKRFYLEQARFNSELAQAIYDLRTAAGLTQTQLAQKIGTSTSVISRLEDADYEGHSLKMLVKIFAALGKGVELSTFPLGSKRASSRRIASIPGMGGASLLREASRQPRRHR